MKLTCRIRPFLLVATLLCTTPVLQAMDGIFAPTGKPYSEPGWNVPDQAFSDSEHNSTSLSLALISNSATEETIREYISQLPWFKLDQPCIKHQLTSRIKELGGGYMYPLQFAIEIRAPLSTINTILELNPPKQYKGYDPFKHILNLAMTTLANSGVLLGYVRALMNYGMSPTIKTAGTSSTEQAIVQQCQNNSARQCIIALTDHNYLSISSEKLETLNGLLKAFTINTPPPVITPHTLNLLPEQTVAQTASTPTTPARILETPQEPVRQISWRQTVSNWCNKPKPNLAKTSVCVFALAAVAVATKVLYNRWVAQKTENPAAVIITNKSGTTITVGYKTKQSPEFTSTTLKPEAFWTLDLNQIKLNLIVTEEETAKAPLPINIERYKASPHQKDTALHITIHKNSKLRSWLSGIPYTYTAQWR